MGGVEPPPPALRITVHGATPLPDKVDAVCQFKQSPGICRHGQLLSPLHSSCRQGYAATLLCSSWQAQWSEVMVKAFTDADALAAATHGTMCLPHSQWMLQTWQWVQFSSSWCMVFGNPWPF
jgi:hypothetical protein